MPILTPTKQTGAMAKASDVVYVEPGIQVTDEQLAEDLTVEGLNAAFLADLLSSFLAHERCGRHLYRSVAGRTNNPVLKQRYEDFGDETERHVGILEELVAGMGGNPNYVSPAARATEASDSSVLQSTFLLAGSLDAMTQDMVMLDAVLLAEALDHANWKALSELTTQLPEGSARDAFAAAVDQVGPQEDDHLRWVLDMRQQLSMLQAKTDLS